MTCLKSKEMDISVVYNIIIMRIVLFGLAVANEPRHENPVSFVSDLAWLKPVLLAT